MKQTQTKTYKNSFFRKESPYSKEFIECTENPILYAGFEIHKRTSSEYHAVKNGVCLAMYGSVESIKKRIDELNAMTTYKITFIGREVGAIGKRYQITEKVKAESKEAAELKLYDKYEHIAVLGITPSK